MGRERRSHAATGGTGELPSRRRAQRIARGGRRVRQVAERAGLSRQAPYNHFVDKEALLAELVRDGFERLGTLVQAAAQAADGTAPERAASAYIGFAQTSPALFRLMFSRELVELSRFPAAQAASASAFGWLSSIVATIAPAERVEELSLAAWCLVHGYATLCIEADLEADSFRAMRAKLFADIIWSTARSTAGGLAGPKTRQRSAPKTVSPRQK